MVIGLALPKHVYLESNETAVTFVVPAPGGCNLNCSFCAIRARGEARPQEIAMQQEDYLSFLRAAAAAYDVGVVSVQGYEPLLPESWSYTEAILRAAHDLGLQTAIVTNGTHLGRYAHKLADLGLGSLNVSVDSADPEKHDRSRGTPGAFEATKAGLLAAIDAGLGDRIVVCSVMQKQGAALLDGLPELLASLGLKRWIVTPMQSFGSVGGTVDRARYILQEGKRLYIKSLDHGIEFELDDELEAIVCPTAQERVSVEALRSRRVQRAEQIIRLSPSGAVSRGAEIRRRINSATVFWSTEGESAAHLLSRLDGMKLRPHLQLVTD